MDPAPSFWDTDVREGERETAGPAERDGNRGGDEGNSFWDHQDTEERAPSSFWDNNDNDEGKTSSSFWDRNDDEGKKTSSFWDREEADEKPSASFWDRNDNEDAGPETNSSSAHGMGRDSARAAASRGEDSGEGSGEDSEEEEEEESSEGSEGSGSEDGAPVVSAVRRRPTDDVSPGNRCRHLHRRGGPLSPNVYRITVGNCTVSSPQSIYPAEKWQRTHN